MVESGGDNRTVSRMSVVQRWLKGQWRVLSETCDAQEGDQLSPDEVDRKRSERN